MADLLPDFDFSTDCFDFSTGAEEYLGDGVDLDSFLEEVNALMDDYDVHDDANHELENIPSSSSSSSRNQSNSSQAADFTGGDDGGTDHDLAHSSSMVAVDHQESQERVADVCINGGTGGGGGGSPSAAFAAAYDEYYGIMFDHHGTAANYGIMFPVGYRFCPSDPELVVHYLEKKVSGQQSFGHPIPDVDLYAENPAQLTCRYPRAEYANDDEWYFFTKREKKYLPPTKKEKKYRKNSNGKQPSRVTRDGLGFWKAIIGYKDVKDRQDSMVGYKRVLDYYFYVTKTPGEPKEADARGGEEIRSEWKMIEYTMTKDSDAVTDSTSTTLDTWVLCKLYLNSRKRKREDDQED